MLSHSVLEDRVKVLQNRVEHALVARRHDTDIHGVLAARMLSKSLSTQGTSATLVVSPDIVVGPASVSHVKDLCDNLLPEICKFLSAPVVTVI